jgi:hypothetical protein
MPELPEWDTAYSATLLAEFKALAAAQTERAESTRAKARQAFTLVAAFFAVAQTAALSGFNASHVSRHAQHTVLHWAIAAAITGAVAGVFVLIVHIALGYEVVGQEDVEAAADQAADDDHDVAMLLARRYQRQVREGDKIIGRLTFWARASQLFAVLALVATTGEIIAALSARL